jgi:hypothetical protein
MCQLTLIISRPVQKMEFSTEKSKELIYFSLLFFVVSGIRDGKKSGPGINMDPQHLTYRLLACWHQLPKILNVRCGFVAGR